MHSPTHKLEEYAQWSTQYSSQSYKQINKITGTHHLSSSAKVKKEADNDSSSIME